MTHNEKIDVVQKVLGFTSVELKLMTQADQHDERLNKLVELAHKQMNNQIDEVFMNTF